LEKYFAKLKHILPVFIIVTFGTVFILSFIRWFFSIKFLIIDINEEVWLLWIPFILPGLPVTIWLRPRFKVLTFTRDNDNSRFFFQIICWGIITVMLILSQSYLTTASGNLQQLSTIEEINQVPSSRYYTITNFSTAKDCEGVYTDIRTSGKNNHNLNLDIYFVLPILKDSSENFYWSQEILPAPKDSDFVNVTEKTHDIAKYWFGIHFKKQISNNITEEEKEDLYDDFYDECSEEIERYNFHACHYFERKPTSSDRTNYLKAIETINKETENADFIILEPIQEKFEQRNGSTLEWFFGSFGIGLGILLCLLIWPGYNKPKSKSFFSNKKSKHHNSNNLLYYLIPKDDHFATSIVLDLTILVFVAMLFSGIHPISPSGSELLEWGANRRFETTNGEWWRLFTSMFVHSGIMHLVLNISGLVIAAVFIEPKLGRTNYFILYILSGVFGSLASIYWYTNTISVGASGAIFGLYGAILSLVLTNAYSPTEKKGTLTIIGIYTGISLLWGLKGGVDNAAHIGGLLSGAVVGIILYKLKHRAIR